jgi:glycosyltransferase involved in cell wall biosynthesis
MKTLLIEGWRGINHSYALVNQYQLLQLAGHPDFVIYHRDMPFPRPEWRKTGSGFDDEDIATLDSFVPPPEVTPRAIDILYRIDFPFRFYGGAANRIFVFGTAELGRIPNNFIDTEPDASRVYPNAEFEIVTPSNWSRAGILQSGFTCPVHVVPHGVTPDLYWSATKDEKRTLRCELDLPQEAFVFLNVGAMMWNKGTIELLRAFAIHRLKFPDSYLVLKSSDFLYGDYIDQAVRVASKQGGSEVAAALASVRIVRDNLSHDEMAAIYRACDAYVSPYLAEAFNMPVLEAIASGLPVIVTAGGPTDDYCRDSFALKIASSVVDSDKGQYLKPDIDSLVGQMTRVVEDTDFCRSAARNGPAWVKDHYSWQAVTESLVNAFRS